MLLESVTLRDVGTYKGSHNFDLAPRTRYGTRRPIVLFGGLNGAGKTTFLSAVRLCLYGRQALESAPTQKEYAEYLAGLVHRGVMSEQRPTSAGVAVDFTYSRLGETHQYKLERSWQIKGSKVEEKLCLFRERSELAYLEDEQAQAFISSLVPAGVASFFFFDGERIGELAKDDDDAVLTDAIRRLMGLDIADRLDSDLSTYVRNRRATSEGDVLSEVLAVQKEYEQTVAAADALQTEITTIIQPALDSAVTRREELRSRLSDRGGAWAVDRSAVEDLLQQLGKQRIDVEEKVREVLAGSGVFAFAPKLTKKAAAAIDAEQQFLDYQRAGAVIAQQVDSLKRMLKEIQGSAGWRGVANRCVDEWSKGLRPAERTKIVHGLSGSEAAKVLDALVNKSDSARQEFQDYAGMLSRLADTESAQQERLRHAPPEGTIKVAFAEFQDASEKVALLEARRSAALQEARRLLWIAINHARKRKKLEAKVRDSSVQDAATRTAIDVQDLIVSYKSRAAVLKCELLRKNFLTAHQRLARKDDSISDVHIDPGTFKISLFGRGGEALQKKALSAGEKQIFAIAMLEALGRTSGRHLPVIIDTPLGRLDSKHREKLVASYFPTASHQVIILSTDTEVDEQFYSGLQPSISHAFHLAYDRATGSTAVEGGYFWRREDIRRAA